MLREWARRGPMRRPGMREEEPEPMARMHSWRSTEPKRIMRMMRTTCMQARGGCCPLLGTVPNQVTGTGGGMAVGRGPRCTGGARAPEVAATSGRSAAVRHRGTKRRAPSAWHLEGAAALRHHHAARLVHNQQHDLRGGGVRGAAAAWGRRPSTAGCGGWQRVRSGFLPASSTGALGAQPSPARPSTGAPASPRWRC